MSDGTAYDRVFAEESAEFLGLLHAAVRGLERDPGDAVHTESLLRGAHSLKGMAAAMGYERSSELAGRMESLLGHVRDGSVEPTPKLLEALASAIAALERLVEADIASDPGVPLPSIDLRPEAFGLLAAGEPEPVDRRLVRVSVALAEKCSLRAVRAHVVIKRLALMGEVTGSEPTATCLQKERFGRNFAVTLRTEAAVQEIVDAVRNVVDVEDAHAEQLVTCEPESALPALSEMRKDALGEVGNIGAGHAATALSEVLGRRVVLAQPELQIVPATEVPHAFGLATTLVVATSAHLSGGVGGGILTIATCDALFSLIDLAHERPTGTTSTLGVAEEELAVRVGTVLSDAYVEAVSLLTGLSIDVSAPTFDLDRASAILERARADIAHDAPWAAFVRTTLSIEEQAMDVALVFIPDVVGLAVLFDRLGV